MKKISLVCLIIVMTIMVSACKTESVSVIKVNSIEDIAQELVSQNENLPQMQKLTLSDEGFSGYIKNYFNDDYMPINGVVYYPKDSTQASEIAVFECESIEDADMVQNAFEDYKEQREGTFAGYSPEQEDIIKNSAVVVLDKLVALIICENAQDAEERFVSMAMGYEASEVSAAIQSEEPSSSEENSSEIEVLSEDEFNAENVVAAYKNGDDENLMPKDKEVYDIVTRAIDLHIYDDMADYEKELAVHNWVINNTRYDPGELSSDPNAVLSPEHDNPYGTLVYGYAICTGYTSTFQLFMDLLEIECISVEGKSHGGTEDHAWNMVKLDDEWYCVDVTWDDPVGNEDTDYLMHTYFNVTSEYLSMRDHYWDEEAYPVAYGTTYSYTLP